MKLPSHMLNTLGVLALFSLSCCPISLGIGALMIRMFERVNTVPIGKAIPDVFPVLVVWQENGKTLAKAVYYKNLAEFTQSHPGFTFLVPEGQEHDLNKIVKSWCRFNRNDYNWSSEDPWSARFEVLNRSDDEQHFRVDATWDDDRENVGWYTATKNTIKPERCRTCFMGGISMMAGLASFLVTLALWVIGISLWRRRFRRQLDCKT